MISRIIVAIVMIGSALGQTGQTVKSTWTTAPTQLRAFETQMADLPASAVQVCAIGTINVVRTSGTVLTIGSGAAAATPQYVRLTPRGRKVIAAVTLTISSGTATGSVDIYGFIKPDLTMEFRAVNYSANTLALSSGTVLAYTSPQVQETVTSGVKLWSWNITTGSYNAGTGTTFQTAADCWVDYMEIANKTAAAVTVTATNGLGTPVGMFTSSSLAANTTWVVVMEGGRFFEQGLKVTVGTAQSVDLMVRGGVRQ